MENQVMSSKLATQSIKNRVILYTIQLQRYKLFSVCSYFLIILETIQIASMTCVTPLSMSSLGLSQFRILTRVLNPEYYFRDSNASIFMVPICFCLSIFHCLLFILTIKKQSRLSIIVHYLFIFYATVGAVPSLSINMPIIACINASPFTSHFTCFQGIHVLYFILSLINVLWLMYCVLLLFLFYIDISPFNCEYFSASSNLWLLLKFAIKFGSSLFITLDPKLEFNRLYLVVCVGLLLAYFGIFRFMWAFYRKATKIDIFQIRCEIIYIFLSIFFLIIFFLSLNEINNIAFLFTILIALFVGQLWHQIIKFQKQKLIGIFLTQNIDEQPEQSQYIQFFNYFINQIQNNKKSKESLFIPLLKIHNLQCQNQLCLCRSLGYKFYEQITESQFKQHIYQFLQIIIQLAIKKLKQNYSLKIFLSFVTYEKLKSKIAAVHSVSHLLKNEKISLTEQISLFKLNMMFFKQQNSLNSLRTFRDFSQKLLIFQNRVEIAIENGLQYWNQLIQQDCQASKIWNLANRMYKDKVIISKYVNDELLSIYPKNIHTLQIFIQLLSTIYRQPQKNIYNYVLKLQNAIYENNEKQHLHTFDNNIFQDNSDVVVMRVAQVDGDFEFVGVSSNVFDFIKIKNSDLKGKNINQIMLQPYHQFHDKKIKQYLLQGDDQIKQRSASIFMLDGTKNIINCVYWIKCLSTLEFGLEFVCFLQKGNIKDVYKRKYIAYEVSQEQQTIQNGVKGKEARRGNIIHIDNELKEMFFGEQNEDLNQQAQLKIQDLLPEWDLQTEKLKVHINNSAYFIEFSSIQIIHKDALGNHTVINYLQFVYNEAENKQAQIHPLANSFQRKKPQYLRASNYLESSISRLNLVVENSKPLMNSKFEKVVECQQPFATPILYIKLVLCIIFCLSLSFSLANFKYNTEKMNAKIKDFQSIEIIRSMTQNLFEVTLQIQNLLYPNSSNVIQYSNVTQMMESLNYYKNQIYSIYSYQVIDSQINIDFPLIKGKQIIGNEKITLNNAISYFISVAYQIQKNLRIQTYLVLINSLEQIYKACFKINQISYQILTRYLNSLKVKDYLFAGLQSTFLFFLIIYYCFRTSTIFKFTEFTFQYYSISFDTPQIQTIIKRCSSFLNKVKNASPLQPEQLKYKKQLQLQQQQNQNKSASHQNNQIQQSKQLLNMRKKITFHQRQSIYLFFLIAIVILIIWVGTKFGLVFNPLNLSQQNTILNRKIIMNELFLRIKLQQLMFDLVIQRRMNTNLSQSLQSLSTAQLIIFQLNSENIQFRNKINIANALKGISQLKGLESTLQQSLIYNKLNESQIQISSLIQDNVKSQIQSAANQNSPLYLIIDIIVTLLTYLILCKLIIEQERIRMGSFMMITLLSQDKRDPQTKDKQKSMLISPAQSI